jgi:hypothetical protein
LALNAAEASDARWLTVDEICRLDGTFEGHREFFGTSFLLSLPKETAHFFSLAGLIRLLVSRFDLRRNKTTLVVFRKTNFGSATASASEMRIFPSGDASHLPCKKFLMMP